ncbi:hypothetical protein, partial [Rhodovulum sp. PH10]|uniref:hypothetical protein n=1 Tax=Rhodovulum sp. PH10 TaxID=1187851 RepID=UPI00058D4C9F
CALAVDRYGRIVALSPSAEAVLRDGNVLTVERGRLAGATPEATGRLAHAIAGTAGAIRGEPPRPTTTATLAGRHGSAVRIRAVAVPRDRNDIGFGATTIVALETMTGASVLDPALDPAHAAVLTPAEREIAVALLAGERPGRIAARRGVSV